MFPFGTSINFVADVARSYPRTYALPGSTPIARSALFPRKVDVSIPLLSPVLKCSLIRSPKPRTI